jgi:hypothetical protein
MVLIWAESKVLALVREQEADCFCKGGWVVPPRHRWAIVDHGNASPQRDQRDVAKHVGEMDDSRSCCWSHPKRTTEGRWQGRHTVGMRPDAKAYGACLVVVGNTLDAHGTSPLKQTGRTLVQILRRESPSRHSVHAVVRIVRHLVDRVVEIQKKA